MRDTLSRFCKQGITATRSADLCVRCVPTPLLLLTMNQGDDPRIVLRDPTGFDDQIVEHSDQPGEYVDNRGTWEQTDRSTNWRRAGNTKLRVYDLVKPTTG